VKELEGIKRQIMLVKDIDYEIMSSR